ncbi:protein Hnh [Pseudomonas ogarae]|nr:protein Hnh [Pseudomonas ogarae]
MIQVHKTPTVPPALRRSHDEMKKTVQQAVQAGAVVVLCTKGTNTAKTKTVPNGAMKIVIDDDQYKPPHAKALLKVDQHGKCAFCEARFMSTAGGDVEHFRPKKRHDGFVPVGAQALDNLGYFQYVYDWSNHLWSCKECNETYKKNYFDVIPDNLMEPPPSLEDFDTEGEFWQAIGEWGRLVPPQHDAWNNPSNVEKPVLINPVTENPREHIGFDSRTGEAVSGPIDDLNRQMLPPSDRGGKNILVLGLNRKELVFARTRHLAMLRGVFLEMTRSFDLTIEFLKWQRGQDWPNTLQEPTMRYKLKSIASYQVSEDQTRSAIEFLYYSTTPQAPFSALAMDALACWSLELATHVMQPREHTTQIQAPQSGNAPATRSVHELPRLGLHAAILATYKADMEALKTLRNTLDAYAPLWDAGFEQTHIEYFCRYRLAQVMEQHAQFRQWQQNYHRHDPVFVTAFLKHERDVVEVCNALETYECDKDTWSSAIKAMEQNLVEYAPDLAENLTGHCNQIVVRLKGVTQAFTLNRNVSHAALWYNETVKIGQDAAQLTAELDRRCQACANEDMNNSTTEMRTTLTDIANAVAMLTTGSVPQEVTPLPLPDPPKPWITPKATGLRKRAGIPQNLDAVWQHIRLKSNS